MKIIYAPSGKRMIPYPPVGPAVLAGALLGIVDHAEIVDLEMLVWNLHRSTSTVPLYQGIRLSPDDVIKGPLSEAHYHYQDELYSLCDFTSNEHAAISIMGFEQLASALLLTQRLLASGHRVILGGQFWSRKSAIDLLEVFGESRLTITVGDGWQAIREWCLNESTTPVSSFRFSDGQIVEGQQPQGVAIPPEPDYESVNWDIYQRYAAHTYRDATIVRRAHLYVWDKVCPYKCAFCRVSSGSKARLTKPITVATRLWDLYGCGVRQFNFMTNELNPTLQYLKDALKHIGDLDLDFQTLSWFTYLRPDHIDVQTLSEMRRLGCRLVRYGVETGSQRLSDLMRKDYQIKTITRVLHDAADADIFNHINLLVGFPGEEEEDIEATIAFLSHNRKAIHSVRINPFYLPPGSPMANRPEEFGIKLLKFEKGHWTFLTEGKAATPSHVVLRRIEKIVDWLLVEGVGFAGSLPFETLNTLSHTRTRDEGVARLRSEHPYMWTTSSPDALKAKFGEYGQQDPGWEKTIYQRGTNYSMAICMD